MLIKLTNKGCAYAHHHPTVAHLPAPELYGGQPSKTGIALKGYLPGRDLIAEINNVYVIISTLSQRSEK